MILLNKLLSPNEKNIFKRVLSSRLKLKKNITFSNDCKQYNQKEHIRNGGDSKDPLPGEHLIDLTRGIARNNR